jgi:acyl-CoA thioester hydrolase
MATTRQLQLTVRYAETDAQGIVHHANYLVWFEEGRSDYLRQIDLNYTRFEKSGYFVVVADASVRYRAPAYYEDLVTIETTLEQAKGKTLKFSYRALRDTVLLAEGSTVHVVLGGPERRPTTLPDSLRKALVDS